MNQRPIPDRASHRAPGVWLEPLDRRSRAPSRPRTARFRRAKSAEIPRRSVNPSGCMNRQTLVLQSTRGRAPRSTYRASVAVSRLKSDTLGPGHVEAVGGASVGRSAHAADGVQLFGINLEVVEHRIIQRESAPPRRSRCCRPAASGSHAPPAPGGTPSGCAIRLRAAASRCRSEPASVRRSANSSTSGGNSAEHAFIWRRTPPTRC